MLACFGKYLSATSMLPAELPPDESVHGLVLGLRRMLSFFDRVRSLGTSDLAATVATISTVAIMR
jgi:hypothetical protein